MALHSVDRHIQHSGDLGRIQIFLVAKYYNDARFLGQRVYYSAKHLGKKQIVLSRLSHGLRDVFKADLRSDLLASSLVDAAMAGDFAQPESQVLGRLD